MPPNHQPLRIAAIEPSGRLYGSEYCLLDIVVGLSRQEFDWRVFLPKDKGFDKLLLQHEIPCEFLIPENLGELSGFQKLFTYGRVLNRLRQLKPDLLYVNQTGSLRVAALYSRVLRLPIVCQVQTLEDARWLSGRPGLQRNVQAFICNSQFIAGETDVDPGKKCVFYQGIALDRVASAKQNAAMRSRHEPARDRISVGILGRIAVSKGHYLLIEAAKHLRPSQPNIRYVVIGEGLTATDTNAYQSSVQEQGLGSIFEFRGYQTDLAKELARIDLLLIPSIAEPLGRVLFDAAEYGVPVVISDAGGLGELGHRFGIGIHFQSENATALADAIIDGSSDYSRIRAEFHSAAIKMFQRLSMQSYLASIEHVIRSTADSVATQAVWLGDD